MPQDTDGALFQEEARLRRDLGIPEDAHQVILFAESSHWDPKWLYTSGEYYDRYVRSNLDQAIDELLREPCRVYSIECIFFLRLYWERQPEQRETVRALVNEDRLRLTSSGVTTADTLLPSAEAILRDLLLGQEWLRAQGMTPESTSFPLPSPTDPRTRSSRSSPPIAERGGSSGCKRTVRSGRR